MARFLTAFTPGVFIYANAPLYVCGAAISSSVAPMETPPVWLALRSSRAALV